MSCFRNRQNSNNTGTDKTNVYAISVGAVLFVVYGFFAEPLKRIQVQSCAYCVNQLIGDY